MGNSLVSWKSKTQNTVNLSSSGAEYRSLASLTCELQWLHDLLQDLCSLPSSPALIFYDDQSAIHIAENSVFHERTKHIDIDCHVVRQKLQDGFIRLMPISSSDQVADLFCKALPQAKIQPFLFKLNLVNLYGSAYGGGSEDSPARSLSTEDSPDRSPSTLTAARPNA